ncbi:Dyp-type peroxidase [Streptomyces sp. NPDC059385]|uniref:Dyp-type peroxidase n=1 Tax=Streptomyces sp. NPDC059385 TaxID=3346817 RepID=UPI0036A4D555
MEAMRSERVGVSRRELLVAVPALAAAGGCGGKAAPSRGVPGRQAPAGPAPGAGAGSRQAGVDRPEQPQTHVVLSVYDLADAGDVGRVLRRLGEAVLVATPGTGAEGVVGPGGTTVTIGLGPGPVAARDRRLPGAAALPAFAREERTARTWGGDLMVQVCADDAAAAMRADTELAALLDAEGAARRWSQAGFRAPGSGPVRNLLGFHDGIEVPRGRGEVEREVWLPGPGPAAGGTVAVVRRLRVDVPGFLAQSVPRQEEVIGRKKADGAPLGGGEPLGRLDLLAKTPHGRYLVPAMAHARRANAHATGSGTMLRRGYGYDNGEGDQGLLFISFQRELRTFTATQRRLDDGDDLMAFVTATASGSFLVLPGFDARRPLGAALFPGRG